MTLKLPSNDALGKPSWHTGSTIPLFEWSWIRADPWVRVGSGTVPNNDDEGYLSTAMPGFVNGASVHEDLAGAGTGDLLTRTFLSSYGPQQEVEVRGSFVRRCVDASGVGTVAGGFRYCGLLTRVGGTYTTTANAGNRLTEHVEYVDSYLLWISASSTSPTAGLTARVTATTHSSGAGSSGTARLVASHGITGGIGNLDLDAGLECSIEVLDASDPKITCKVYGYTIAGQPTEVTLFDDTDLGGTVILGTDVTASSGTLTDAHADQIQQDGGFGFLTACTRDDTVGSTSVSVTEGVAYVRVSNTSGGILFEDTFERIAIHTHALQGSSSSAFHLVTSIHGDIGAWCNGLFSYGGSANTSNAAADVDPLIEKASASATVDLSATSPWPSDAPNDREFWSSRPSDYDYTHHRSIEFKPFAHQVAEPNWATSVDVYEVMLRGIAKAGAVDRCWSARLVATIEDSGGATQTALFCYVGVRLDSGIDGTVTYLDLWRADLQGTVDLLDAAWHSLQYDVHTYPDATDSTAPRLHIVKVDGTQVVFDTAQTWSAGTQVLADGTIFDHSDFTQTGSVEGFGIAAGINQTDGAGNALFTPAQVRNWDQETLAKKSSEVSPEDQASYSWVTDEGASESTGDLLTVCTPTFPFAEELTHSDPLTFRHETGHETTRARSTRTRRRYSFQAAPMTQAEADTFEAFWEDHGVEVPFDFQPDGESAARTCRFVEQPVLRMLGAKTWVPSISIEEVLS